VLSRVVALVLYRPTEVTARGATHAVGSVVLLCSDSDAAVEWVRVEMVIVRGVDMEV
jgi:hypothetical protein